MIVNSFLDFLNESNHDALAEMVANRLMSFVRRKVNGKMVSRFSGPIKFTIILDVHRSEVFPKERFEQFKRIPWESINFERNGFAVDANSRIDREAEYPTVEIVLLVNPKMEPGSHKAVYYKLLDLVRHEIEHLTNNDPAYNQDDVNRKDSQSSYKYFLLPDEIPSMVSGMRLSAIKKGVPIEKEFEDYLSPILASGFITKEQYDEIMSAWTKFAFSHFPDTK